ncbi:hypothetical protein [Halopseudomonas bauzanensis]|uniref:DUF4102 domain-containing protein n=1 Tax=Halopseudomonas bauzanensis TaxID=653930 RepID=A0A4U0YET3_9GAMM|nr:hypothetical protein [Halopseudomonas bauzanensis]TKA90370.1 hypothetical protein FA869_14730 [Halopseudomonas bauzanensis]
MNPIIQIRPAGNRVLPGQPAGHNFWQLTKGDTVVGWATSYPAAQDKQRRLEQARLPAAS